MKLFFLLTCFAAEAIISKLECSTSNFVEQKRAKLLPARQVSI